MVDVMRIVLNKRWCTRLQNQIQRAYFFICWGLISGSVWCYAR